MIKIYYYLLLIIDSIKQYKVTISICIKSYCHYIRFVIIVYYINITKHYIIDTVKKHQIIIVRLLDYYHWCCIRHCFIKIYYSHRRVQSLSHRRGNSHKPTREFSAFRGYNRHDINFERIGEHARISDMPELISLCPYNRDNARRRRTL